MEAKTYDKNGKKIKFALISSFLSSLISVISLFFLSQILISLDPLKKKAYLDTPSKNKKFGFLISICLCIKTAAFPTGHYREC